MHYGAQAGRLRACTVRTATAPGRRGVHSTSAAHRVRGETEAALGTPLPLRPRERWALALLAIGGCMFLPFALDRFVFPKLSVVTAGVLLASTVPARGKLSRAVIAICFTGLLLLMAGAVAGTTPVAQVLGRPPRYEGVLVMSIYLGAFAAGARLMATERAPGATSWWLRWLTVAALAIAVEAVLESAGLRPLASNVARPGSLLGNASDEGAWGVLALGPLATVALRVGGRWRIAGAVAAAVIVVCSGSRGALLGAAAAALVVILLTPRLALRAVLVASVALIAVGVFTLPETRNRVVGSSPLAAHTASGRTLLWTETLKLLANKPLLGAGPSGYIDAIPAYHNEEYERKVGPQDPPESPHNVLLQAATSGGIGLALLAIALAGVIGYNGSRARREQATGGEQAFVVGMLAGLAGYTVALLFYFTTPGSTPLAAFMAGAVVARPATKVRHPNILTGGTSRLAAIQAQALPALRRAAARGWQVILAVLVVLFTAAAVAEIPIRSAITAAASGHLRAANNDFRLARELQPWDGNVAATAAHAYAALIRDGIDSASKFGAPWSVEELRDYPNWVEALSDGVTINVARGQKTNAWRLLRKAITLDPANPVLRSQARLLDPR